MSTKAFNEFSLAFPVFGGLMGGGAIGGAAPDGGAKDMSVGDSIESSVLQLSLSLSGSQIIEGKRPCLPALEPVLTMPFHHPSSTPLGIRFRILILSPERKDISSEPVAS